MPVISEQTFVLGSNGTSLFPPPSWKTLDDNQINTTFLAHGPSSNYRQLRGMLRRYESRKSTPRPVPDDETGFLAIVPQSEWDVSIEFNTIDNGTILLSF